MSKAAYAGVGGVARTVTNMYVGVNGVARRVIAGYVGVNGIAQQFWPTGAAPVIVPCTLSLHGAPGETIYWSDEPLDGETSGSATIVSSSVISDSTSAGGAKYSSISFSYTYELLANGDMEYYVTAKLTISSGYTQRAITVTATIDGETKRYTFAAGNSTRSYTLGPWQVTTSESITGCVVTRSQADYESGNPRSWTFTAAYCGTGGTSGGVELDSSGEGEVTLNSGTWYFKGSISEYSVSQTVSGDEDVYVYPEGIIYWYGRIRPGATLGTALGATSYANRSVKQNTNNIVLSASARYYSGTRYSTYAAVYFTGVDVTGYTDLKFDISAVSGSSGTSARTIGQASSGGGDYGTTITTADTHTVTIRSISSYPYIGAKQNQRSSTSTSYQTRTMTVAAIWME